MLLRGISTATYNQYLFGHDEEKAEIMVQIDDYIKEIKNNANTSTIR